MRIGIDIFLVRFLAATYRPKPSRFRGAGPLMVTLPRPRITCFLCDFRHIFIKVKNANVLIFFSMKKPIEIIYITSQFFSQNWSNFREKLL